MIFALYLGPIALAGPCVVVIFGGAKEWITLAHGLTTDISIDVNSAVKAQAAKTGCRILAMANDSEKEFYQNLEKLKSPLYSAKGTTYHFAFTDHGAPPGTKINDSVLITGQQEYTTYAKFMGELKRLIPKGSHITIQTNTCWGGNMASALFANNMDNEFSICSSSSTAPQVMSWNLHDLEKNDDGQTIGPYGAVGLSYANDFKKTNGRFPGLDDFHHHAKRGDLGNLAKLPGHTTSVSFAEESLAKLKIKSPLGLMELYGAISDFNWTPGKALDQFLARPIGLQNGETESILNGVCLKCNTNPFSDMIKRFSPLYKELMNQPLTNLPSPFAERTNQARNFLLSHQKQLAALLTDMARERAEFVKKNEHYPKEKYASIEESWKEMVKKQEHKLSDYLFNLRLLQEGKTVQLFFNTAGPNEKKRFQKYLDCELAPLL